MAKTDGCGGHGKDTNGKPIRDEDCDMCQRWSWRIHEHDAQKALADAEHQYNYACREIIREIEANPSLTEHEQKYDMWWYEDTKQHWRAAGTVMEMMLERGFTITRAPVACSRIDCGKSPADEIHQDILVSTGGKGPATKLHPDQHPFEV